MRSYSYLNSAVQIIEQYNGKEPLASFLKSFFARNKKFGSKDRKQISHLCYCYFRLGKSVLNAPVEERILMGLFLCANESTMMLGQLRPGWNGKVKETYKKKYVLFNVQESLSNVFPWKEELSDEIDHEKFCESFFIQPDLFLRIRPGHELSVKQKLAGAAIHFTEINGSCLSLPNNSKIERLIELDKEAVVQDYNSQRTAKFLRIAIDHLPDEISAWDCCAGSGGKSMLLHDVKPGVELTVSDVRESIVANLKKRFARAGIKKYKSFVADVSKPVPRLRHSKFELVICDAPCTGSGTWSRTPEQLYFFDPKTIEPFVARQKRIVSAVIPYLRENGFFVYITCSVFKKENEQIVNYIDEIFRLKLIKKELLAGYEKKADTMFISLFQKKS